MHTYTHMHTTGTVKSKMLICTRCKTTNYCSKDCQLVHWKGVHKLVCKSLDDNPDSLGGYCDVDPTKHHPMIPAKMYHGIVSLSHSERNGNIESRKHKTMGEQSTIKYTDKVFEIKYQLPDSANNIHGFRNVDLPCLVYDKKRSFTVYSFGGNTTNQMILKSKVREKGTRPPGKGPGPGMKAYFKAYTTNEGKLRIFYDQMVTRSW